MIIGKKIIFYPEIDSTSEEAKRLIKKGAGEGLVIVAEKQTSGRGKPGNQWYSPIGGVYLSAVVKPFVNPKDISPITILGAQAALASILKIINIKGMIKLPNDVLIRQKKVGGVLVERLASGHLIIGIGVNINNEEGSFPEEIAKTATSFKIETGHKFTVKQVSQTLIEELDAQYLEYLNKV